MTEKYMEFQNLGLRLVRSFFRPGMPPEAAPVFAQRTKCHLADEKRPDSFENVGAPTLQP